MSTERITYTDPELCTYDNDVTHPWFVYFDITDNYTRATVRKQFRGGINYLHTVQERLYAGNLLKKYWEDRLKHGWSPFIHTAVNNLARMQFNESLDWALAKCQVAKKTKEGYAGTVQFFKAAAKKLHFDKSPITAIKKQHILLMLDEIKEKRRWSNHAYNKNAGFLSGVLSRLVDYEILEHNPAHNITFLPTVETDKFEAFADAEKIIIRDELTRVHPSFFTYLMLIYHTGIRPKECLALKIGDILLYKSLIIIKPNLDEENSKTKAIRMVPINKFITQLLTLHIEGYENKGLYVFGSPNGPGGNRGSQKGNISGAMRSDYFLPSPFQVKRDTATRLWNRLVIVRLKINKYMYALKHTGADDKIMAGIPIDALKQMYGHSSKYMTETYARKIIGVYREQIILNSPDF